MTYAMEKDIFPKAPGGVRCSVYHGILDLIFKKIKSQDADVLKIFESWLGGELNERD